MSDGMLLYYMQRIDHRLDDFEARLRRLEQDHEYHRVQVETLHQHYGPLRHGDPQPEKKGRNG